MCFLSLAEKTEEFLAEKCDGRKIDLEPVSVIA
jgi:hypothetical protein